MKKIFISIFFFFSFLLLQVCNSGYLNIYNNFHLKSQTNLVSSDYSIFQNTKDCYIPNFQNTLQKQLFVEITDVEEENEETSLVSKQKFKYFSYSTLSSSEALIEHLYFKLHKNILAYKASHFTPSLRRYLVFQNYRI